jgi:hypothetical protein
VSGAFDPYHRWLGISPKDQPPNHYRLLAIDLLEADPEVIRDAAERQMAHVRTYQLGQYVELSQRILNELAGAKACLLDPAKKAAYDASPKVQAQQKAKTSVASVDVQVPAPPPQPVKPPGIPRPAVAVPSLDKIDQPPRLKKPSAFLENRLLQAGAAVAALAMLAGLLVFVNRLWNSSATINEPTSRQRGQPSQATVKGETPKTPDGSAARSPKIAKIANQTIDLGATIQFKIIVSDPGTSGARLRFGLAPDAPTGAAIDPHTGMFTWTPTRRQCPGEYPITVHVLANGQETLSDRATFRVIVRDIAGPPAIQSIAQQIVTAGDSIDFPIRATNPDGSSDHLTFSLSDAPSWVSIDSATGVVACKPAETQSLMSYPVTVRVANDAQGTMQAERSFAVVVVAPVDTANLAPGNRNGRGERKSLPSKSYGAKKEMFEIKLPSGKVLSSVSLDVRGTARRETDALMAKCIANSPDAIGSFQEGSNSVIAYMANISLKEKKPHGPAVYFHAYEDRKDPKPRQYVNYKSGRWDGILATWNVDGQREFWCNYASGQRNGLCCLFNEDALIAVLECTRNKIDAVHMIEENQVAKSFTDSDQALADAAAGPVLRQIDTIEQGVREEDNELREAVKDWVQKKIGVLNSIKRQQNQQRSKERNEKRQQDIQSLRKKGGL